MRSYVHMLVRAYVGFSMQGHTCDVVVPCMYVTSGEVPVCVCVCVDVCVCVCVYVLHPWQDLCTRTESKDRTPPSWIGPTQAHAMQLLVHREQGTRANR